MTTLALHSPQEIAELYEKLSISKKETLFNILNDLLNDEHKSDDEALESFIGCLADKVQKTLTIEEMNEITALGWAGKL